MVIGVDTLPVLPTDPGDRNRTSPFAFTGNRFEFRAPGSLQTVAAPMVTINTIMADSLDYCATELEAAVAAGTDFDEAVQTLLGEDHQRARRGRLQRRRLLGGVADRGGEARTAEPADHARRAARAHHRQGHRTVREVQGVQRPRDAQPLRDRPRAVHPHGGCRGTAHARARRNGHPARCGAVPDGARRERRRAQGGRRRARPVGARGGVRTAGGPQGRHRGAEGRAGCGRRARPVRRGEARPATCCCRR